MAKLEVDYQKLKSAQNNSDDATSQASAIEKKISVIYSGLDGRVQGMVSGVKNLITRFDNIEKNLLQFSENIMNTIYQI